MTDTDTRFNDKPERFLRVTDVTDRLGMSKTSLYLLIDEGEFPEGILIRSKIVVWLESDVDRYIAQKARTRRFSPAFLNSQAAG
jgi:prophage regulatory protein